MEEDEELSLPNRKTRRLVRPQLDDSDDEEPLSSSSSSSSSASSASSCSWSKGGEGVRRREAEEERERSGDSHGAAHEDDANPVAGASPVAVARKEKKKRWVKRDESEKEESEKEESEKNEHEDAGKDSGLDDWNSFAAEMREGEEESEGEVKRRGKERRKKDKKKRLELLRRKLKQKDGRKKSRKHRKCGSSGDDGSSPDEDSEESASSSDGSVENSATESSASSLLSSSDEDENASGLSDDSSPPGKGCGKRSRRQRRRAGGSRGEKLREDESDGDKQFAEDDETAACTLEDALAWCFDSIVNEEEQGNPFGRKNVSPDDLAFLRRVEHLRWDDELTLGGARPLLEAFDYQTPRPVVTPQVSVLTKEQKAIVFLDFPNEMYKTEYLHLRVFDWKSRRVIVANLLKCAAQQLAAWRDFDSWLQETKRFGATREEKINKMFQCRVAEPRGLRKLQHLLLRAEQCGLVERNKSLSLRRCLNIPASLLAQTDRKQTVPSGGVKAEQEEQAEASPEPAEVKGSQTASDAATPPSVSPLTASASIGSLSSPSASAPFSSFSVLGENGDSLAPPGSDNAFLADAGGLFAGEDLLFNDDDSSLFDGFDLTSRWTASAEAKAPGGWGALKRTVNEGNSNGKTVKSRDQIAKEVEDMKMREKELKRQRRERRDEEKKDARILAMKHQWRELQRIARCTHEGPRFHHPREEEHVKGQEEYTSKFRVFAREELVYIRPPQEVHNKQREALDLYLAQLRRMPQLMEAPHKLKLAAKFGLISLQSSSADALEAPTVKRLKANAPWLAEKDEQEKAWKDLATALGQEPWNVPLHFIPASIQPQWSEKKKQEEEAQKRREEQKEEQRRQELAASALDRPRSRSSSPLKTKLPTPSPSSSSPSSPLSVSKRRHKVCAFSAASPAGPRRGVSSETPSALATPQSKKKHLLRRHSSGSLHNSSSSSPSSSAPSSSSSSAPSSSSSSAPSSSSSSAPSSSAAPSSSSSSSSSSLRSEEVSTQSAGRQEHEMPRISEPNEVEDEQASRDGAMLLEARGEAKEGEKGAKKGEKGAKEGEKGAKEGEKGAKEGEKGAKEGEKGAKEGEKGAKEGEKGAKEGEKGAKEGGVEEGKSPEFCPRDLQTEETAEAPEKLLSSRREDQTTPRRGVREGCPQDEVEERKSGDEGGSVRDTKGDGKEIVAENEDVTMESDKPAEVAPPTLLSLAENRSSASALPSASSSSSSPLRSALSGEGRGSYNKQRGPRQMKLTELFRFTLDRAQKRNRAFPSRADVLLSSLRGREPPRPAFTPSAVLDDDGEELAKQLKRKKKRRLVTDDGEDERGEGQEEGEKEKKPETQEKESSTDRTDSALEREQKKRKVTLPDSQEEEEEQEEADGKTSPGEKEGAHEKKTPPAETFAGRLLDEARRARRKERRRQMKELIRQMTEFEAEENDEELEGDEEYKSALAELRSRLMEPEEDELSDSDEEFLEGLFAAKEDEVFDAEVEDTEAMQRKLRHDLEEREDKIYERLIGRFQKGGENAVELTEAERRELEEEERRRRERLQRKKRGDEHLAGIELDDWLSDDSEDSSPSEAESEEEEDQESLAALSSLSKWSSLDKVPTLASLASASSLASPASLASLSNPSLLVSQCRENAERRKKVLERRKRKAGDREREKGPALGNSRRLSARGEPRKNCALSAHSAATGRRRQRDADMEEEGGVDGKENRRREGEKDGNRVAGLMDKAAPGLASSVSERNEKRDEVGLPPSAAAAHGSKKASVSKQKNLFKSRLSTASAFSAFGVFGSSSHSCSVRFADDDSSFGMRGDFENSLSSRGLPGGVPSRDAAPSWSGSARKSKAEKTERSSHSAGEKKRSTGFAGLLKR
ncbi:conserved hypothetical protein [Neospora caninum Liverpool]|uniref:Uncharacterized protein n=1 Tax=Neospora caninum (strain Liverpool) TaxID=572307 RepID=F0VN49_NEOCL|nr:conserved hypothetical protein [Neospora caninum Liverpool]CBZ55145.1 conserved hypothetical protein [Neospora caninum Liverpool]CEL69871.1 TPA: hypothetical protein BN1204_055700 [Neospora caninum Liverpool]|eukprot:XP_003885173.1 conserved hypothetical protein [Neospora caninum Liverpool]